MPPRENPTHCEPEQLPNRNKPRTTPELAKENIRDLKKEVILEFLRKKQGGVLRLGRTGMEVVQAKNALNYLGFRAGTSRTFDEKMENSVKAFQENRGIIADGIVGPKTIKALQLAVEHRIVRGDKVIDIPTSTPKRIAEQNGITYRIWDEFGKDGKPSGREIVQTSTGVLYRAAFDNRGMPASGIIFYPDGTIWEGSQVPANPRKFQARRYSA